MEAAGLSGAKVIIPGSVFVRGAGTLEVPSLCVCAGIVQLLWVQVQHMCSRKCVACFIKQFETPTKNFVM